MQKKTNFVKKMPANTATFQDIAQYTGLSKTTISRYFNRPETLTEKHREKIPVSAALCAEKVMNLRK